MTGLGLHIQVLAGACQWHGVGGFCGVFSSLSPTGVGVGSRLSVAIYMGDIADFASSRWFKPDSK